MSYAASPAAAAPSPSQGAWQPTLDAFSHPPAPLASSGGAAGNDGGFARSGSAGGGGGGGMPNGVHSGQQGHSGGGGPGLSPAQQVALASLTPQQRQHLLSLPPAQQQHLLNSRAQETAFQARLLESLHRDAAASSTPVPPLPPTITIGANGPPQPINLHKLFMLGMQFGGTQNPAAPLSLASPGGAGSKSDQAWSTLLTQATGVLPGSGNRADHDQAALRQVKEVWERYLGSFERTIVANQRRQQQQLQAQQQHSESPAQAATNPFQAQPGANQQAGPQSRSNIPSPVASAHHPSPSAPSPGPAPSPHPGSTSTSNNASQQTPQQLLYSQQQQALLQQQLALQQHQANSNLPPSSSRQPSQPPGTPASHPSPVGGGQLAAAIQAQAAAQSAASPRDAPTPTGGAGGAGGGKKRDRSKKSSTPAAGGSPQDVKGGGAGKRKRGKKDRDEDPTPSPALSHASVPSSSEAASTSAGGGAASSATTARSIPPLAKGITGTFTSLLHPPAPPASEEEKEKLEKEKKDGKVGEEGGEGKEDAKEKERKRRKVEYCPLTKANDYGGGWGDVRAAAKAVMDIKERRVRTPDDLGMVDIFALTMSLRSRLATEVVYALNALSLIVSHLRPSARDGGIVLPLERCEDLLDELLDLLEETAFDVETEEGDEEALEQEPPSYPDAESERKGKANGVVTNGVGGSGEGRQKEERWKEASLREMAVLAVEEESRLKAAGSRRREGLRPTTLATDVEGSDDLRPPVGQVELLLSILHILRGFSCSDDSILFLGHEPRVASTLLSLCGLRATSARRMREDFAEAMGVADMLRVRREVVQTLANLGTSLDVSEQPKSVCQALLELGAFYCEDGCQVPRQPLAIDTSTPAGQQAYNAEQSARRRAMDQQHDAALSLLAHVAVVDRNRTSLGRCDIVLIGRLTDMILQMLPLQMDEFVDLRDEEGLTRVEMEAMSLFNLIFMSPRSTKLRLFHSPALSGAMVRLIRILIAHHENYNQNPYSVLVERCIAVLRLCAEAAQQEQQPAATTAPAAGAVGKQWFGGGFADEEPRAGEGEQGKPSPLATRRKVIMDILSFKGISAAVFNQLSALLDG